MEKVRNIDGSHHLSGDKVYTRTEMLNIALQTNVIIPKTVPLAVLAENEILSMKQSPVSRDIVMRRILHDCDHGDICMKTKYHNCLLIMIKITEGKLHSHVGDWISSNMLSSDDISCKYLQEILFVAESHKDAQIQLTGANIGSTSCQRLEVKIQSWLMFKCYFPHLYEIILRKNDNKKDEKEMFETLHLRGAKEKRGELCCLVTTPDSRQEGGGEEEPTFYSPQSTSQKESAAVSTRLQFGGNVEEGGKPCYYRQCVSEEHRDKVVNMGFGHLSAEAHFDKQKLATVWHSGVEGYDMETSIIPELAKVRHYGDKTHSAYNAKLVTDEMQELYLVATYYNRFINESIKMSKDFFPSSDFIRDRLAKSVTQMGDMKKMMNEVLQKMKKDGREIEVAAFQMMLQCIEENHKLQVLSFQHQSASALNTLRILDPISKMLTTVRNLLAKMPSVVLLKEQPDTGGIMPAEDTKSEEDKKKNLPLRRDPSPSKPLVPKTVEACSEEQKEMILKVAVSLGRDAASAGAAGAYDVKRSDPFDIGLRCPAGITLPPMTDKVKAMMSPNQLRHFGEQVRLVSLEQGILLLEARYLLDEKAWELGLEWPRVALKNDPLDLWRFLVLDETKDQYGKQLWEEEREEQLSNLFMQWLETEEMTKAIFQLLLAIQNLTKDEKLESLAQLPFIYTGLPHEFWSVGWLKNRIAHRLPNMWKFSQNMLGVLIKKKAMKSVNEFLAYKESRQEVDEQTQRGAQWKQLVKLSEERERVWFFNTTQRFEEAKVRMAPRVVALQQRVASETFVANTNNRLQNGKQLPLFKPSHLFYPFKGQRGNLGTGRDDRGRDQGKSLPPSRSASGTREGVSRSFDEAPREEVTSQGRGGVVQGRGGIAQRPGFFESQRRGGMVQGGSGSSNVKGGYYYYDPEEPDARYAEKLYAARHPPQDSDYRTEPQDTPLGIAPQYQVVSVQPQYQQQYQVKTPEQVIHQQPPVYQRQQQLYIPESARTTYIQQGYSGQPQVRSQAYLVPTSTVASKIAYQDPSSLYQYVPQVCHTSLISDEVNIVQDMPRREESYEGSGYAEEGRGRGSRLGRRSDTDDYPGPPRQEGDTRGRGRGRGTRGMDQKYPDNSSMFEASELQVDTGRREERVVGPRESEGSRERLQRQEKTERVEEEPISPKPMSISEKEEGEISASMSPITVESMQISPFSSPPVPMNHPEFVGVGPINRRWIDTSLPIVPCSKKFCDFDVFNANQKPISSPDEFMRFARYRKQNSKGNFELATIPAFRVPILSRQQMNEDIWIEYKDVQLPMNRGIMFQHPPQSFVNQYRMKAQPRILDSKARPFYVVASMAGGEKIECPRWFCREPSEEDPPLPTLPGDIRIPLDDISQALHTFSASPNASRQCNILYLGDSTIPGLIRPLEELITAVEMYPGAPKYGSHLPVFGRGKVLHQILNVPPFNTDDCNFLIMKFQNDFMNIFGAECLTQEQKEGIVNRGIPEVVKEIEFIVTRAQTHMMGMTIIIIGMNPVNTDVNASWMFDDPCAVEFARRVDYHLRNMVAQKCDVHYLSVVEIFAHHEPLLSPRTGVWGAHLTELSNFFIAKELRRIIFYTYATRSTFHLADVKRFSLWHAQKGLLFPDQETYCSQVLGLIVSEAGN